MEKDIPYGSKGYPFLGAPCHPVTVSPTCAKKNKGSLSENIDNPLLTSPRVDVIQGNTIALFFLVMAAGGYGRPCERTVTLRGKPAGEGRPGRKMRARAASPFPEPFMQYKETQMNTRGFSLVRRGKAFRSFRHRQTVAARRHRSGTALHSQQRREQVLRRDVPHPPERLHRRSPYP